MNRAPKDEDAASKSRLVLLISALAVTAAIAGAIILNNNLGTVAGPNAAPSVTRQRVLDATAQKKSIVVRADRMEAKLTTWSVLQAARGAAVDQVTSIQ